MTVRPLGALVADGDLDELVREVDRCAGAADWDRLLSLRAGCLEAASRTGRQLFGPAQYAAYRVALEGPPALAASVVEPGASPFALGPLTEVVAQQHTWDELAPHLDGIVAVTVAQERVIRGEDLRDRAGLRDTLGDAPPLVLQSWEPAYPLPEYRADELLENGPPPPAGWEEVPHARAARPVELPRLEAALRGLVAPWSEASTGEVHVAAVAGDAAAAVASVVTGPVVLARLRIPEAFAAMAWAAGSGGAHGRRRGLAAGRDAAWWVARVATGLETEPDPDELEYALEELRWYAFAGGGPAADGDGAAGGWRLHLVVADGASGWAVAVDASDAPRVAG